MLIALFTQWAAQSQTIIPAGKVSGDWKINGSPYIVQGVIEVDAGKTLNINPFFICIPFY